jgi:hypothetical protein
MRVDGGAGAVVVGGDVAGGIVVGGVVVVGVVVVGVVVVGVVVGVVRGSVVVDEVFGAADIGVVGVLPVPEAVRRMTTMAATTAAPMAPTMTRFLFMAHSSWTLYWGRHIGKELVLRVADRSRLPDSGDPEGSDGLSEQGKKVGPIRICPGYDHDAARMLAHDEARDLFVVVVADAGEVVIDHA